MQVKVTEKVKGELFIRALGKTFRVNSKIPMSQEQFSDSTTQAAIRRGLLSVIGDVSEADIKGQYFLNTHKNAVSFRCIDMSVPSKAVFFVSEEFMDDSEIQLAENKGRIEKVDTPKSEVTETKSEAKETEAKKTTKKKTKRVSKKKKEESLVEEETSEIVAEVVADQGPETNLPEFEEVETPEGSYVHDPREGAEPLKVRRVKKPEPTWADKTEEEKPKSNDLFDDGIPDLDFVDEKRGADLDFVDQNGEVS